MAYKKIILRRDTAANWTSANPTLSGGEVGIETDTLRMKLGNGSTAWNSLSYYAVPSIDDVGDVTITSASSGQFLKWNGTAWVNDTIDLGTDTAGAYVSSLVAGTGVTLSNNSGETATPTIAIGQAIGTGDSPSFAGVTADAITIGVTAAGEIDTTSGNLTIDSAGGTVTIDDDLIVSGNLTVSGTTTTLNTETLAVEDNIIVLNSGVTSSPATNAGIEVERGTSANVVLRWNETTDKWQVSENGTDYYDVINSDTLEYRLALEHWHHPVRLSTFAVLPNTPSYTAGSLDDDGGYGVGATLESSANARLVIDGVNATTGDRVLVKNQVNAVHNGVYNVTAQGSASDHWILTRASDMNGSVPGQISIGESVATLTGDNNYYQQFSISSNGTGTNGAHVIGTDSITFVQYTGIASFNAGNGLGTTGNTLNVVTADSSRIVVGADNIDLAPITQSNVTGSAGLAFVSAITRDGYGRVTGVTTNDVQVTLSTNTTGDYVQALTAGTGITLTGNSGEAALPTINVDTTAIQARVANVTDTEISYLDGVTSSIQLQLNDKAPTANPTFTGTVTLPANTISQSMMADDSVGTNEIGGLAVTTGKIADGAVTEGKIADGAVTSAKILNGAIVNDDVNASAAIAHSKLANATAGQVLLGTTTTGVVTATTISGDITIDGAGVASIAANSVALGTDTTGDYVASLVAGTGVTLTNNSGETSTPTIAIGQAVATNSNVTFNDLTVSGNLTVSGTTTTINTDTLHVADNIIILNNDVTGSPTENAGIEVERGTSANVLVRWNETTDKWEATNDGTTYGNLVTTADSGTVTSTMIVDGTIVNADINASAAIELSKLATSTAGNIIVYNASGVPTSVTETGDVTISDTGVTSIASGVIVNADVSTTAAIDLNKLADASTNAQTTSYTLVLADKNKIVEMGVGSANNLTVPPNSSVAFPVGTQINVLQTGAGQTTVVAGAGVTVNATPGLKIRAQWSYATLIKRATDTWVLVGDTSA
jgi:hypothetical protein